MTSSSSKSINSKNKSDLDSDITEALSRCNKMCFSKVPSETMG